MPLPTLIVIAGPTAVGKTGVAIQLAQQLNTEIISADSRQCYTGMAIGTAQPTAAELSLVPHHFIHCFSPEHALSAADYEKLGLAYLKEIFSKREYAVLCGGTGLYIRALCDGIDEMPATDPDLEISIHEEYQRKGIEWLQQMVSKEDPAFYAQAEMANPHRLLRALIFHRSTGQSITHYRTGVKKDRPFRIVKICLELPRAELYERINIRVDEMMRQGLLQEVQQLYPFRHLKNLNTVGYTELFDYLEGRLSLTEAVDQIKQHSRNYAKRQVTWFRKDTDFHWLSAKDPFLHDKITDLLQ